MGPNPQLLIQIRDAALMGNCAERTVASPAKWQKWKDVSEWCLVSEGGHNTAPHMDSHGFATWLTVQKGEVGFGWMSHPTDKEVRDWAANPSEYTDCQWRYVVLRRGETVFFNSGTIHFVFRVRGCQTLMLGGHVLLWSDIDRWIDVINIQKRRPESTNEDMEDVD